MQVAEVMKRLAGSTAGLILVGSIAAPAAAVSGAATGDPVAAQPARGDVAVTSTVRWDNPIQPVIGLLMRNAGSKPATAIVTFDAPAGRAPGCDTSLVAQVVGRQRAVSRPIDPPDNVAIVPPGGWAYRGGEVAGGVSALGCNVPWTVTLDQGQLRSNAPVLAPDGGSRMRERRQTGATVAPLTVDFAEYAEDSISFRERRRVWTQQVLVENRGTGSLKLYLQRAIVHCSAGSDAVVMPAYWNAGRGGRGEARILWPGEWTVVAVAVEAASAKALRDCRLSVDFRYWSWRDSSVPATTISRSQRVKVSPLQCEWLKLQMPLHGVHPCAREQDLGQGATAR